MYIFVKLCYTVLFKINKNKHNFTGIAIQILPFPKKNQV